MNNKKLGKNFLVTALLIVIFLALSSSTLALCSSPVCTGFHDVLFTDNIVSSLNNISIRTLVFDVEKVIFNTAIQLNGSLYSEGSVMLEKSGDSFFDGVGNFIGPLFVSNNVIVMENIKTSFASAKGNIHSDRGTSAGAFLSEGKGTVAGDVTVKTSINSQGIVTLEDLDTDYLMAKEEICFQTRTSGEYCIDSWDDLNVCDNGIVLLDEDGNLEECDDGAELNGVACEPGYLNPCSYCSRNCKIITKTGGYCGDGIKQSQENCSTCPSDYGVCPVYKYAYSGQTLSTDWMLEDYSEPPDWWHDPPEISYDGEFHEALLFDYNPGDPEAKYLYKQDGYTEPGCRTGPNCDPQDEYDKHYVKYYGHKFVKTNVVVPRFGGGCGNGVCGDSDETCSTCAIDCGPCDPVCGNGFVEGNEECDAGSDTGEICQPPEGTDKCPFCNEECKDETAYEPTDVRNFGLETGFDTEDIWIEASWDPPEDWGTENGAQRDYKVIKSVNGGDFNDEWFGADIEKDFEGSPGNTYKFGIRAHNNDIYGDYVYEEIELTCPPESEFCDGICGTHTVDGCSYSCGTCRFEVE